VRATFLIIGRAADLEAVDRCELEDRYGLKNLVGLPVGHYRKFLDDDGQTRLVIRVREPARPARSGFVAQPAEDPSPRED